MESVKRCNLCGETEARPLVEGRDRLHGNPTPFRLVQCTRCGLIYLSPRPSPDELGAYYPEDYISFPGAIQDEPSGLRRLDRAYGVHKRCQQVIRRAGAHGRLLDVGCATGIFLDGMRQRGWEVMGLEPNRHAAQYARQRLGLDVRESYLEEAGLEAEAFDAITLWDVLEHVPYPDRTLAEVRRLLRPGGLLVLSLPNPDSWERHLFGRYWAGWDMPRHFHIFSQATLSRYLRQARFGEIEVASFTGRHGVLALSIQFWMTDWKTPAWFRRWMTQVVRSLPARALTWPWFNLADRLNKSSIMTVFARKSP